MSQMPAPPAPGAFTLVLARAQLDAMLTRALARASETGATWLAHAELNFQRGPADLSALAGQLQAGSITRSVPTAANRPAAEGVFLLALAPAGATPPDGAAAWEEWMQEHASSFRLATAAAGPALAVLWLRADGLAAAVCRCSAGAWRPFTQLRLPGAHMLALEMGPVRAVSSSDTQGSEDQEAYLTQGRYSRQAGGLGTPVLSRLQSSRIAVVGLGRTGSVLAHSLARMGCSLQFFDPDMMEPHNLDGDLPPLLEGRPKAEAAARFVRGLMRPGAELDARILPIASPAAGSLLLHCDVLISCVDNDAARLWANAWALALNKPLLDVATGLHPHGAEADIRLLPPGSGCLACVGGLAQQAGLQQQLAGTQPPPMPADFRRQRRGSLRSWGVLSAHMGLRLLEHMYAGRIGHVVFRRLVETEDGGLLVEDSTGSASAGCPLCAGLQGAGSRAVHAGRLQGLAAALAAHTTSANS
jgi:molybdopterin/thiamine biosynthesis adenylyltransferase